MHPTLAGLHPFLLGSPAMCAFLSYYMCIYYLGFPARSQLSRSCSCPNTISVVTHSAQSAISTMEHYRDRTLAIKIIKFAYACFCLMSGIHLTQKVTYLGFMLQHKTNTTCVLTIC